MRSILYAGTNAFFVPAILKPKALMQQNVKMIKYFQIIKTKYKKETGGNWK